MMENRFRVLAAVWWAIPCVFAQGSLPSYRIETFAGGYVLADHGPAAAALLMACERVLAAPDGTLYIADTGHHRIRRVSPSGLISTVAGDGSRGFGGDGGPATAAQLNSPAGLALDGEGNLYIADTGNNRVRRLSPTGAITTVAGSATNSTLRSPKGVAVDASGNLFIADTGNNRVMRLPAGGQLTAFLDGLSSPNAVAVDRSGVLYIADTNHHLILRADGTGVRVIAGTGVWGFGGDGAVATSDRARISLPTDLAVTRTGDVYFADSGNGRVRRASPDSTGVYYLSTIAGGGAGSDRFITGQATRAAMAPRGVSLTGETVWVADAGHHKIYRVEGGNIVTVAGVRHDYGDGGPAASASLSQPHSIVFDNLGNLIIADTGNHKIRAVDSKGIIRTVAGTGLSGSAVDGVAPTISPLSSPVGLASDSAGFLYVGDTGNSRLRRLREGLEIISIAGSAGNGNLGDGSSATQSQVRDVRGVAVDAAGNVVFSDTGNHRVRRINTGGLMEKWAGTGVPGLGEEAVHAYSCQLRGPRGLAFGPDGSLFVADTDNHRVRRIRPDGVIETVAGTGAAGYANDGGPAKQARLSSPAGIAIDRAGNLLIADTGNHRIRIVDASGVIRTLAGRGSPGYSGDAGPALTAQLNYPTGLLARPDGSIYVADRGNDRIRRLAPEAYGLQLMIVSGNLQSGLPGSALPQPLVVRLVRGPAPVAGTAILFRVLTGVGTLSAASAVTAADGTASVTLTLGTRLGPVVVSASAESAAPVQFELTVTQSPGGGTPPGGGDGQPAGPRPRISPGGVTGAGLSIPKVAHLAPLGLYTIFGSDFTDEGNGGQIGPGDVSGGQLPIRFRGVCVEAGGALAPVVQVYPTQITFQAPALFPGERVSIRVLRNCRDAGETASDPEPVEVRAASPEFFFFVQNRDGRNPVAAVHNDETRSRIGPPGLIPGESFSPARPGDVITLFATGLGVTNPYLFPGQIPAAAAQAAGFVEVRLGSLEVSLENVLYAGVAPGYAGLYQIDLRIPEESPSGDLPVEVRVGGVPTPAGAYLTVRR